MFDRKCQPWKTHLQLRAIEAEYYYGDSYYRLLIQQTMRRSKENLLKLNSGPIEADTCNDATFMELSQSTEIHEGGL